MFQLTLDKIGALFDLDLDAREVSGIAFDSRALQPGQLFVALKGQKVDGHDFIEEAVQRGAVGLLVSSGYTEKPLPVPQIRVEDTLKALHKIAKWRLSGLKAKVIGVTGSLGKTTTKEFLYQILKTKYRTAATSGNLNTQISMATSLMNNIKGDEEFVVVEMGMTQAGQIKKLVEIIPPDMALMTTIALVHAENFDSIEDIARAKAELFSHPKTELVIINRDSPCSELLYELAPQSRLCYSMLDRNANYFLEVRGDSLRFSEEGEEQLAPFVDLVAPHVYLNCLAACSMARACNMSWEEIFQALSSLKMPEKRLEVVERAGITFINDAYNASETSMKGALSYVKERRCSGKRVAIIGQMRELGKFSKECHRRVAEHALECVDRVFCLGVECEPIVEVWQKAGYAVEWYTDLQQLVTAVKKVLEPNDLVLLKGSRSNELWRVLDYYY